VVQLVHQGLERLGFRTFHEEGRIEHHELGYRLVPADADCPRLERGDKLVRLVQALGRQHLPGAVAEVDPRLVCHRLGMPGHPVTQRPQVTVVGHGLVKHALQIGPGRLEAEFDPAADVLEELLKLVPALVQQVLDHRLRARQYRAQPGGEDVAAPHDAVHDCLMAADVPAAHLVPGQRIIAYHRGQTAMSDGVNGAVAADRRHIEDEASDVPDDPVHVDA
jgi:hypothetical protein